MPLDGIQIQAGLVPTLPVPEPFQGSLLVMIIQPVTACSSGAQSPVHLPFEALILGAAWWSLAGLIKRMSLFVRKSPVGSSVLAVSTVAMLGWARVVGRLGREPLICCVNSPRIRHGTRRGCFPFGIILPKTFLSASIRGAGVQPSLGLSSSNCALAPPMRPDRQVVMFLFLRIRW